MLVLQMCWSKHTDNGKIYLACCALDSCLKKKKAFICIGTIYQTTQFDVFYCLKLILTLLTTQCLDLTWHKNGTRQQWLTDRIFSSPQASSRPLRWATLSQSERWSPKVPMQNDTFSDEGRGGIDSFPLFQSFLHSRMEIKLLEIPCNFYNYLGADRHTSFWEVKTKWFSLAPDSRSKMTSGF